jgi:hypothetical protein
MQQKQLQDVAMLAEAAITPDTANRLSTGIITSLVTSVCAADPAMSLRQLEEFLSVAVQLSKKDEVKKLLQQSSSSISSGSNSSSASSKNDSSSNSSTSAAHKEAQLVGALHQLPAAALQVVTTSTTAAADELQPESAAAIASILRSVQQLNTAGIPLPSEPEAAQEFYA